MIINKHVLRHADDAGNGYHGRCEYCNLALVTDLGYDSWSGTKCIDREISLYLDIPKEIREYADFRGYRWDNVRKIFVRASFSSDIDEVTIDELNEKIQSFKIIA